MITCSERGPETLRVFSNCDMIRVIIPSAEMNERRDRTCVGVGVGGRVKDMRMCMWVGVRVKDMHMCMCMCMCMRR